MGLTVKRIAKLARPGRYHDGPEHPGFYLQVTPSGVKSWLLRYQKNGVERWMGLGPAHAFTLEEARERARRARQLLADGVDPLLAKREEKQRKQQAEQEQAAAQARRKTFKDVAEAYLHLHLDTFKNAKHRYQWRSTLATYVYPIIGDMTVADIGPADVLRCIEPIWKAKRETASRVRQRIERIFDYATTRAYRAGDNPAAHVTESLPRNGRNVEHLAALPYAELPAFMAELRKRQGIAARALELTILTAARTGETIGALWDEIDLKAKTWVVPADRMKARQEHTVPLSDRVVDILKHLPREGNNQHVFVGPKAGEGLSNMAMTAVLRRMGRGDITVHGFRSTFRTWASEQTAFPHEVCEKALAHTIPNAVERAYNRGALLAKRKQLMDAWSKYCASPPATAREANVVPLRGA